MGVVVGDAVGGPLASGGVLGHRHPALDQAQPEQLAQLSLDADASQYQATGTPALAPEAWIIAGSAGSQATR